MLLRERKRRIFSVDRYFDFVVSIELIMFHGESVLMKLKIKRQIDTYHEKCGDKLNHSLSLKNFG